MKRASKYPPLALAVVCLSLPAAAAEVHKWVDENGVTHYSDAPPPAAETAVIRIEPAHGTGGAGKDGYHSIANQWARMHRERLERERIKLEKARIEAARQAARTEVVCVEKPAAEKRYAVTLFPGRWYRHAGHRGSHYRVGRHHRHPRHFKPRATPTTRADAGFYKHVQ